MPSIEFYYMPESPPCRAVEMVAEIVGVTLNKHYVNLLRKENLKEEYIKINPMHKVPFIIDGDVKINESRAISAYLVNRYMPDDNTLYPRNPIKRAKIDELLFIDIGSLYPAVAKLFQSKLYGLEFTAENEKAIQDILEYLDNHLKTISGGKFMTGNNLTIADISILSTCSTLEVFNYDLSKFETFKAFLDHSKNSIPKYHEINDGPNENYRNFVKTK